jgi:hypothetical protein
MLVIDSALGFLQHPGEDLEGTDPHLLDRRLELTAFLALHRKHVAGRINAASFTFDSGNHCGAPFPGIAAERGEDPDRVYLLRRNDLGHRLGQPVPAGEGNRFVASGHAEACSHRSV